MPLHQLRRSGIVFHIPSPRDVPCQSAGSQMMICGNTVLCGKFTADIVRVANERACTLGEEDIGKCCTPCRPATRPSAKEGAMQLRWNQYSELNVLSTDVKRLGS